MSALRLLTLATVSLLIGGCGTVCPAPGNPGFNNEKPCTYSLVVTNISVKTGEVTAQVSPRVENQREEFKNLKYTFAVHDLKRLVDNEQIKEKTEYLFFNAHNGPILEVFPRESNPQQAPNPKP